MSDQLKQGLWRVILTDLAGNAISNVTKIAEAKVLTVTRNRPAMFAFTVKSDDSAVSTMKSDGFPLLAPIVRGVRAYRCEGQSNGAFAWILRFAGHVWQLEDSGDAEKSMTSVVCYDPTMRLNRIRCRRMIYDAANLRYKWTPGGPDDQTYTYDTLASVQGSLTATALVDRANAIQWCGLTSTSGVVPSVSHSQTVTLADGAYPLHVENVMTTDQIVQLSELYNAFDFQCVPDESAVVTPAGASVKRFGYLQCYYPSQGAVLTHAPVGWQYPPNNAASIKATTDGQNLANDVLLIGSAVTSDRGSGPSQLAYQGLFETIVPFSDISTQALLDALASEELLVMAQAQATVEIGLQPGLVSSILPFDNFNVGDTLIVNAGSKLRGGFIGAQLRVEQYTLTIDDDKGESVAISSTPVTG